MNFIDGITISNYRSFGPKVQKIGPCSKINIIIGKNNSGKSNILRFLWQYYSDFYQYIRSQRRFSYKDQNDIHLGLTGNNISFGGGCSLKDKTKIDKYIQSLGSRGVSIASRQTLKQIISIAQSQNNDILWVIFKGLNNKQISEETEELIKNIIEKAKSLSFDRLLSEFCGKGGGKKTNQLIEILRKLILDCNQEKDVSIISALRQIIINNSIDLSNFNGAGLITELARIQDPEYDERDRRELFLLIQDFLKNVTNSKNARINIPFSREYIQVDMTGNGNYLPLESLGTGIHDTIILAAACTIFQDQIVCIEEPELHLHPILQKKFIQYINEHTNNQYFISTHSAHLLNTTGASIFHVTLENGESIVSTAYEISEKSSICRDLGYQPSDIFQTNCIIWVEGPSDRIYLNYWIHGKTDEFKEGIHYSIMFYGGKLLSNLSSEDDPLIDDFISLRKLNRRMVVIMDSDREKSKEWINSTKRRIRNEIKYNEGLAWVTNGREIENYLSEKSLIEAIKSVHSKSNFDKLIGIGQYGCKVKFLDTSSNEHKIDKMRVAKKYIEIEEPNYSNLDLNKQIDDVIKFIEESNKN